MSSIEDWSSIEYSRPLDTSTLGSQKLLRSTVVKFPNRGRTVWPTRNNKNIIVKMNFHNPTATDNFTFLDTLTGAVTRSSFLTSQCPPPEEYTSLATVFGGSTFADMSAAEVDTTPCILDLTGDTQAIEDSRIGANTRKKYMRSLVTFIFWLFEWNIELFINSYLLQHAHKMNME